MGEESEILKIFAGNLRRMREGMGLSQEELAHRAGLDRTYVSGCERGVRNATLKSVEKLADALEISPQQLISK